MTNEFNRLRRIRDHILDIRKDIKELQKIYNNMPNMDKLILQPIFEEAIYNLEEAIKNINEIIDLLRY